MSAKVTAEYKIFFKEIKERIYKAQYDALKAVNKELINLYWDIGKSIVAKQEKLGWIKDVLINQLEAGAFERYMANQTNFDKAVPEKYRHQAKLAVKDEYSFDFLEIGEEHSDTKKPIGVSTYRLTEELQRELKKYLPSPEEMIAKIQHLPDL